MVQSRAHPLPTGFWALCLAVSAFFGYQTTKLSFRTNLGDFYPLRHPYLKIQGRLNQVFGGLNQVSLAIEVKDGTILNPLTLEKSGRSQTNYTLPTG
jgi:predicted RND superfamily exporter protein